MYSLILYNAPQHSLKRMAGIFCRASLLITTMASGSRSLKTVLPSAVQHLA